MLACVKTHTQKCMSHCHMYKSGREFKTDEGYMLYTRNAQAWGADFLIETFSCRYICMRSTHTHTHTRAANIYYRTATLLKHFILT